MKSYSEFTEDINQEIKSKTWTAAPSVQNQGKLLSVNVAKFDKVWSEDPRQKEFYIPKNSSVNTIGKRKELFSDFFAKNDLIQASSVSVVQLDGFSKPSLSFMDGRHRFSYLRDQGAKKIPIFFLKGSDYSWIKKNLL
jgi:hypothetical protein